MLRELWFWSAMLNLIAILPISFFAVALSEGAGLSSYPALIRLLQRIFLCALAFALLGCALHQLRERSGPSPEWFIFQISFMLSLTVSILRHIASPAIPREATWGRRVVTELKVK